MSGTVSSTLHMRPHACPVRSKLLLVSIPRVREGRHGVTQHMTQAIDGKWQQPELHIGSLAPEVSITRLTLGERKLFLIYFCQKQTKKCFSGI